MSSTPGLLVRQYWDAADTHRLNEARYSRVQEDQSINDRTAADLPTVRSRCIDEAEQNPTVDGVIFTHQVDIVGRDGPELQVQSSSPAYNEWLEKHWRQWFRAPTPNPRLSGATMLRLWVRSFWEKGEYLAQKITKKNAGTPVTMRLQPIGTHRLATPADQFGNNWLAEGIEIRPDGEPLWYHIQKADGVNGQSLTTEFESVPAADIIHQFIVRQEDQLRGKPWLSSSLGTAGDLRDYDQDVGEAARQAANQGVYWFTAHSDAKYIEVDDQLTLERGTQSTGPPGWEPRMLTPQQPSTQYKEYREERQAEIGRTVSMPLMIVRLDAGRHNYSSARFDGKNYDRACEVIQYMISGSERSVGPLSELADDVAKEAALYDTTQGQVPPERPDDVVYDWTWPRPPHVDPQKEADATASKLATGTMAYQDALAEEGQTLDGMIAKRQRANEKLKAAELPPMPTVLSKGAEYAQHELATGETPEEPTADGGQTDPGKKEPASATA
jgi:lambda family phage portal protein